MNTPIIQYPLDLSGTSPTNLVRGEVREIPTDRHRAFVPSAGPFYTDSLKVYNDDTNEPLKVVDDYVLFQPHLQAQLRSGKDVQSAIMLTGSTPIRVRFDYQVVGGEYSWNLDALIDLINLVNADDRPIKWAAIVGKPTAYPPAPHIHDVGDSYG